MPKVDMTFHMSDLISLPCMASASWSMTVLPFFLGAAGWVTQRKNTMTHVDCGKAPHPPHAISVPLCHMATPNCKEAKKHSLYSKQRSNIEEVINSSALISYEGRFPVATGHKSIVTCVLERTYFLPMDHEHVFTHMSHYLSVT